MAQYSTNYEMLKSLYLRGHALPGVVPHVEFKIDLDDFKGIGNLMSLLGALNRDIARIDRQIYETGSPLGPTVAVYELVGSVLHIRAAVVDVPKARVAGESPPVPSVEPLTPPKLPPPVQLPLTDPSEAGDDVDAFAGRQSAPPCRSSPGSGDGENSRQQQDSFEEAAWRTRDILKLYKDGKIKSFEALTVEIEKGPNPDRIKHWLTTVERDWQPWETGRGLLDWDGLRPITGYLPSKLTAALDAEVYKVDSTNRTASLLLQRLHTRQHAEILAVFGTPRRPYVPVSIATAELTDLLAFYRGIALPVRLSLTVRFSLVETKKPELLVTLTCPVETSPTAIKEAVEAKLALVLNRPKQLGLWDRSAGS